MSYRHKYTKAQRNYYAPFVPLWLKISADFKKKLCTLFSTQSFIIFHHLTITHSNSALRTQHQALSHLLDREHISTCAREHVYFPNFSSTSITSFTCLRLVSSNAFSSLLRSSSITRSTPFFPNTAGTPR